MRAHFINEKFVQDSDPIHDMDIGIMSQIEKWYRKETSFEYVEVSILWVCCKYGKYDFVKFLLENNIYVYDVDFAFFKAIEYGHLNIVELFLKYIPEKLNINKAIRVASNYRRTSIKTLLNKHLKNKSE